MYSFCYLFNHLYEHISLRPHTCLMIDLIIYIIDFHFPGILCMEIYGHLGRYSTFQYPDQDTYQYPYPEDLTVDRHHIPSCSIRQTYLSVLPYFKLCLHNSHENSTPFIQNMAKSKLFIIYMRIPLQGYDVLVAD